MPMYPKTVGECVTVKIKQESQPNGGRMHLDDQLAEMLDIMIPVGELKTFATDEVDAWVSKMAAYNQVWAEPDGSLLKKSDYPDLFTLIGYKYGWSNSNPNGTYTHTFTDVDGNEKSLVLYNDLDIDGNAKAVSGSPAYFRLPNFAGRFLRCAGTATYANKWADTDGNEHEVLTTYTAELYKGKLDAQRDITGIMKGQVGSVASYFGVFNIDKIGGNASFAGTSSLDRYIEISFCSSRVIPSSQENIPASNPLLYLLRIS